MQDANPAVGGRQLVGDASRSVGRIIVDDQHVGFGQDCRICGTKRAMLSRSLYVQSVTRMRGSDMSRDARERCEV